VPTHHCVHVLFKVNHNVKITRREGRISCRLL